MASDAQLAELIQILERTVSINQRELAEAQQYLKHCAEINLPEFLKALSEILRHGENSQVARMAAGLQLKNHLVAKDPLTKKAYQEKWKTIPENVRAYIKNNILASLGTEDSRRSSAAQCVACIAAIELPAGQWSEVIPTLTANVIRSGCSDTLKEASLEAIGYICQDLHLDHGHEVQRRSNEILTAIIHEMRSPGASNYLRLAATNALTSSLVFTRENFERENERNVIMEVVCEATQCKDIQVQEAALECLVEIMALYYDYMENYMSQALFPITLEAMKSNVNELSLQGLEFWSTVAEEEIALQNEVAEAASVGRIPTRTLKHYATGALRHLIPVVLSTLTKQEDFEEDDGWNPSRAAGVCLELLSTCCKDSIVPLVLPFIHENIRSADWRCRDAALTAFGTILDALQPTVLQPLVKEAIPTLIGCMDDNSVVVRETAAWTFHQMSKVVPETLMNEVYLQQILEALIHGLKSEPRVASNVCWAFTRMAEACYELADVASNESDQPNTYILSPYFDFIVQQLFEATTRSDGDKANLRLAAYEALMVLVKCSPKDCYVTVQKATLTILERLNHVLTMEQQTQNPSDRAQFNDLQGLHCATLHSVLSKMTSEDAPKISDQIMAVLLKMFSTYSEKSGSVQEDAIMAVSALVEAIGVDFKKYMPAFKPFLCLGLNSRQAHEVCCAAIGLTGDIFRTLREEAKSYCDEIMTILLEALADPHVHHSVKAETYTVFGEIALGIGPEFKRYLNPVLQTLQQALSIEVDKNDSDLYERVLELQKGIMNAYSGIIQGLKTDDPNTCGLSLLKPHIPNLIQFVTALDFCEQDSELLKTWAGLIGDISSFGQSATSLLDTEVVRNRLIQGSVSTNWKTRKVAKWAIKTLQERNPGTLASGDADRMEALTVD